MTIYLEPPTDYYRPGGPDGKGWNRLSLNAHMGTPSAHCALRPRMYPALFDVARDTRLCQWGTQWAACDHKPAGDCAACPRLTDRPRILPVSRSVTRVMVRVYESDQVDDLTPGGIPAQLRICVREDGADGDASAWYCASVWTWEEIAQLVFGPWRVGRQFHDTIGPGFWLHRRHPEPDPDADDDEE